MRTVRYDDVPDRPWRNGGGTTREVHRDERWRLSVATICAAGPFSPFPGVDRTFVVARGTLTLTVAGTGHRLGPGDLLRFAGEDAVSAVPDGPVTAVNVMTTRPHEAHVWVGIPSTAEAFVDLTTLQTHVAVTPRDLHLHEVARGVVVEGIT
ncbi:HutD/Ves family protein [Kineococcus sp. SYSU DK003]|uniref:HutD/Ves family protein n=1 Tax=Kineococcus sp. SYSU DK003 TaxID=3383124 RepID=UPI003D7E1AA8